MLHILLSNRYNCNIISLYFFSLQQAASLEKVIKEQQQQLELERGWDQEKDREIKGNGSSSPNLEHRVQDHSPSPSADTQKNLSATIPLIPQVIDTLNRSTCANRFLPTNPKIKQTD